MVEKYTKVTLEQLRSSGKEQQTMFRRRLFSLTSQAYGYKGREIAKYLQKEPSSVTKYARGESIQSDLEKVSKLLRTLRKNGNCQV